MLVWEEVWEEWAEWEEWTSKTNTRSHINQSIHPNSKQKKNQTKSPLLRSLRRYSLFSFHPIPAIFNTPKKSSTCFATSTQESSMYQPFLIPRLNPFERKQPEIDERIEQIMIRYASFLHFSLPFFLVLSTYRCSAQQMGSALSFFQVVLSFIFD